MSYLFSLGVTLFMLGVIFGGPVLLVLGVVKWALGIPINHHAAHAYDRAQHKSHVAARSTASEIRHDRNRRLHDPLGIASMDPLTSKGIVYESLLHADPTTRDSSFFGAITGEG